MTKTYKKITNESKLFHSFLGFFVNDIIGI